MTSKELSLHHIIRPSSLKVNPPVLFMLHGYGSDENDLFSFASELPLELFIISIRAPFPMQPFGNAWYTIHFDAPQGKWNDNEQAIESRDKIAKFLDEACSAYEVDNSRVTLLGFSQGTILSIAVALSYPDKVKNVIALSGYVSPEIISIHEDQKAYSHLDFYCSHGSSDQVIPVLWARKTPEFLNGLNIKHVYNEFPVGHGVAPQNFYDFKNWLVERL
ncbi:MAG: alpha/beta fold hydrolase [Bacteroidia bacterium]|nr:alpha/beta fold hydrolase [Bacteroidia bacterium]NND24525.1 alpha/beta fold hydrolase [Flavobacteriaceae bacterium]MBT8277944.1 alpha/beta fold hydrolase [Bacteroidia bacterium]NNK60192.1 alpha/beta fold hydrolase [Flavobacteriaceae bacterium]NNL31636.1 alpha/beta fold hydrolase [Flavobacteriaceae bacterium]